MDSPAQGHGRLPVVGGVLLALTAWGVLVTAAIRAGRLVREQQGSPAWVALWSVLAVVALFCALVLLLRLRQPPAPPRSPGGRHAAPRR